MTTDQTVERQAVVVLGMHRGGTSALAGVLGLLCLRHARTPLPPARDNPTGFFESHPFVLANHHILAGAGAAWHDCLDFDVAAARQRLGAETESLMLQLLRQEFGEAGSFVVKDPRLCLMLPLWLPMFERLGASVHILIIARHPVEVARSLAARNAMPHDKAVLLWLHHMLEAERLSRGHKRAVLIYDDLIADWRRVLRRAGDRADIAWPKGLEAAAGAVDSFLSATLRHHTAERSSAFLGPEPVRHLVAEAWLSLQQLARSPEDVTALACLDHARLALADWRGQGAVPRL